MEEPMNNQRAELAVAPLEPTLSPRDKKEVAEDVAVDAASAEPVKAAKQANDAEVDVDVDSDSTEKEEEGSDEVETEKEEEEDDEEETEAPQPVAVANVVVDAASAAEVVFDVDLTMAQEAASESVDASTPTAHDEEEDDDDLEVDPMDSSRSNDSSQLDGDASAADDEKEGDDDDEDDDDKEHEVSVDAEETATSTDEDEEEDDEEEEKPELFSAVTPPSVPPTMTYPVNEMEVVTNRGGRSGSLSKFLDDADLYRRRSLTALTDDPLGFHEKKLTLDTFLNMAIDPILEVLDDADSDVRLWLMQPDTVEAVLKEFVKPPVFDGEPHEEYGYYKNYFVCSEIIMKLYTGEEDLYESFSSDSSSGSACVNAVFGCQEGNDVKKWDLLYSIFDNPAPLDEMQLLFFSKALVRLHDGFCLEDGYVTNVLRRFLPRIMPHMYSNTIKYMLTLILQSYESVHPITGRNDAMEIIVPVLAKATRVDPEQALSVAAVENAAYLVVDMLQANQADRLGAFIRREGGVYLSKYFVRDQFGTIRGFESMTHGYHNFLQFMLLEELSKLTPTINDFFDNALFELEAVRSKKITDVAGCLNVQVATELLLLFKKHGMDSDRSSGPEHSMDLSPQNNNHMLSYPGSADMYPASPRQSAMDNTMYNLVSLSRGDSLWSTVREVARSTAQRFCEYLNVGLPSSVEIAVAKHLHALVHLNDPEIDAKLHEGALMQKYLTALEQRSSFDMLLIHIVPAIAFVLKDVECSRSQESPLMYDMFDETNGRSLPQLLIRADQDIPSLKIYANLLKDVIDEILMIKSPTESNAVLQRLCKRCAPWSPIPKHGKSLGSPSAVANSPTSVAETAAASTAASSEEKAKADDDDAHATDTQRGSDASFGRRSSSQKRRTSSQRSDKNSTDEADAHPEGGRKSHYIKQMLQTPVFRGSMRLGSVIKPPEKAAAASEQEQSSSRGSFGWNSMLKRLRKSLVTNNHAEKGEKKYLAIANEPYAPPVTSGQTEVLVVDTSKGEDISKYIYRDGGVHVTDVPSVGSNEHGIANVVTSGYMYKNKMPETGQRHLWERYYFVLNRQEGSLSYYVSESHAKDRTFLRGTARPVSVTEGIPVSVSGQHTAYGFQINTQGHGSFMVAVDSIDSRLIWLTEIVTAVSALSPQAPPKRLSLAGDDGIGAASARSWNKQQLKEVVVEFYRNLFGPNLRFSTPMDAPASFWMEEKIDPVADSCVLSSNLPDCVPYWGEFHGYKRLCDFWKIRDETIERSSGRVLRIVVDEDEETAVVMTSTTYRILRNSQVVTEEACDILNLSGGTIISIHCTFDSYRVAEAFRKEGISAS
ncbi:hypothetical protein Poli38472_010675 [Pythium oligandrum]|uniref:PH domain-containing protein n=1 Tax=Pythium oligandrum TaxID=41045 RepID=A0A8K1C3Q8_PYTOL|nr:hypothetical protein Poli38472_010675 [Pythium oligandrum]|eukprot:TMW55793.1 hypothetical protein Poli38472_010675 [Pythium oligandrum]